MDDIIDRIKHKLAYLQEHDDGDVTEADFKRQQIVRNHYPYRVHTPHTEDEIAEFEAEHQIRLPEDYRRFIMEIGSRGFNPAYMMFSPLEDTITHEKALVRIDDGDGKELAVIGALNQPFPFEDTMPHMATERYRIEHGLPLEDDAWRTSGYLEISYDGCTCWYILIITGEVRGQIWYMDAHSLFAPVYHVGDALYSHNFLLGEDVNTPPSAHRVNFTEWYEVWLNQQIRIAQEHWHKRGRVVPLLALDDN